ncbi:1,4-alpha-glucan branching protein GlgB [Lactobacillus sp. CC-MHH1034]|uniref:1,4-alpha-glucan branching protein GlgB n=1 Tax=Agrilactobacillus fermenti TaxID=2586909 RepID=UPI001E464558|nr:1,4-alpha-glucan branching protein GlgB [Agrilactobacillus fermenti]MCD2255491.1 1,4-alpha-glucan branching protein GlgB [Agrilactobacillus fermenti]
MAKETFEKRAYLFNTGAYFESYEFLGCHQVDQGFQFNVWAPHAKQVYLVGDFNHWSQELPMKLVAGTGIWTVTSELPRVNDLYKFGIQAQDGSYQLKVDPYAFGFEHKPGNGAVVLPRPHKIWHDADWLKQRQLHKPYQAPVNIYEVHLGSWQRHDDGSYLTYREITEQLIPYVKKMHYSHVEFMPLMEHLLDASWGYQLMGYFAPTSRFGSLVDFLDMIDAFHAAGIGVIMDWVPGHFIRNTDALAQFDGTPTFEYADFNRANNVRWGSWNFDLGKTQVQSFLISSAMYWLDYCHLDGLRVDAVSNMLYLDYDAGKEGTVNQYGDNGNLEGQAFIKKLNTTVFRYHPDILMIAEESSAFPKVTAPVDEGGLGFNYKWNMGWMHDTLKFFEMDPLFRHDHFNLLTFSFLYMYDEQFILPFSHDEVVHGKQSLMHKMPGDRYNQFANLRTMLVYMMAHPGKKLLFMGSEWGQFLEWRYWSALEWVDLNDEMNHKMQQFTRKLNAIYHQEKAFWQLDHDPKGINITNADDPNSSTLGFIRLGKATTDFLVFAFNLVPVEKQHFRIPVPYAGTYTELLNTEMQDFGGTWTKGQGTFETTGQGYRSEPESIEVILPAMSALIIKPKALIL